MPVSPQDAGFPVKQPHLVRGRDQGQAPGGVRCVVRAVPRVGRPLGEHVQACVQGKQAVFGHEGEGGPGTVVGRYRADLGERRFRKNLNCQGHAGTITDGK